MALSAFSKKMLSMGFLFNSVAMMRVKWQMMTVGVKLDASETDLRFCYDILQAVSRSFAVVIMQLNDAGLRDGICIFYLVLRALDTIEDDMSVPVEVKLLELSNFHKHLEDPEWRLLGVGEGRERELLEKYPHVTQAYKRLKPEYQEVISDICEKMAKGMCDFLQRPVVTKGDYDLYCHYVAGLVGHGLTRLFAHCGFEDPHLADDLTTANHMGLFLQKTNIIRDYFEDIREEPPRMFWPKEIWGPYAVELADLKERGHETDALTCLNTMVADALQHVPHVLEYMASLKEPSVFRFCAIPQVMAIATLLEVYNNLDTYQIKVKIAKPAACRIMVGCGTLYSAITLFAEYILALLSKLDDKDDNTPEIRRVLTRAMHLIDAYKGKNTPVPYIRSLLSRYPGLGGNVVLNMADNISGYFRGGGLVGDAP